MLELRQTIRRLRRARRFTLTTVLTLAMGIGATIAIFTVVNGILLNAAALPRVPYRDRPEASVVADLKVERLDEAPRPRRRG